MVTVIIPVFNGGAFLRSAVESILQQSYKELDVIIVDDGSTDNSVAKLSTELTDSRLRWIVQPNSGKAVAVNNALAQTKSEYYLLQDSDDLSHPDRVTRLLKGMQQWPCAAAVFSGHDLICGNKHMAPTFRDKSPVTCKEDIDRMAMPGHDPTAIYRMALVKDFRYEPTLRQGQGYDYILRVGEVYPMAVIGECLYSYRIHPQSITRVDPERRRKFVWEVIRRACERRGHSFEEWASQQPRRKRSSAAERDNGLAAHYIKSVQDQLEARQRLSAILTGLQCARMHPLDLHYLKALICAISPFRLGTRRKRKWV